MHIASAAMAISWIFICVLCHPAWQEASAKLGTGVTGVFMSLARRIVVARKSLRASTVGGGAGTSGDDVPPPTTKASKPKAPGAFRCVLL